VKNERIFRKIDAISKEKELIELEVVKKDDEIAVLSKKNQDITAKLERTRGQLSVAEQQIDDDRRINSVLRQDVKTYQGAAEKANSNHQRVSSDFCSEQVLRTTAETSAKDFKSNFETEQKNAIALAEHMAKLELEKKILDKEAAEKDKKIMEQTNRVHNAQAFILLAEDRANEVEKECLRMLNDKLEIIEAERTGAGDAESRATTLESENAAAKTRAAKAKTAKSAAEARVVIAETECEIVKSENETLKAASATRFKLVESLLSKNTQLEKDGEDLMAANRNLSAGNTNLKTQNEELRTKNTKLETLIENAKRDLATQQQLTKKAQSEAKRAREDLDTLQITVDQQIATINTHNSLINEQYAKIIQIESDNKATRQENGELCNRLMAQFTQKLEDLTEKNAETINKLEDKIHQLQNPDLFFDAEDSVIEIIHEKLNKINEDMESANNKSKNSHNTINDCKKTIHYAQNELHIMNYHPSSFWLTSFVCFLFIFSAFNNKVIPGIFQLSEPAAQDNGLNYDFLSQPDNKGLEIPETQCNWTYAESSQTLQPFQRTSIVALHFSGSQAAGLNSAKKVHDIFGSSGIDSPEENILAFLTFSQLFEGFTHAFDTPQKVAVWGFLGGVSYLTYQYIHIR
jgi:chromosome segregation ATPase